LIAEKAGSAGKQQTVNYEVKTVSEGEQNMAETMKEVLKPVQIQVRRLLKSFEKTSTEHEPEFCCLLKSLASIHQ
jgi:hypothetical protein